MKSSQIQCGYPNENDSNNHINDCIALEVPTLPRGWIVWMGFFQKARATFARTAANVEELQVTGSLLSKAWP